MNRISSIITEVSRKFGIEYKSKHLNEQIKNNSIAQLSEIYVDLKSMISKLSGIEDHYPEIQIKDFFEKIIEEMETIDHEIIYQAIRLSKRKKNV